MEQVPANTFHMILTEDELLELENLSALGYSNDQMAMYFGRDTKAFERAAADENSRISYHMKRGVLKSVAQEQLAILKAAEGGNVTASVQLSNIKRNRGFKISQKEIFSGFDDMKTYRLFENWVEGGCKTDVSQEESVYLEALCVMNSMDRKYGRRNTIAFFVKKYGLTNSRASTMYDEAVNLFNTDRNADKKALRNKYADQLDEMALVMKHNINGPMEAKVYGDLITKAVNVRQLDQLDPEPVPKELFLRPVRLFSLDPAMVGMERINRQKVAEQIEALDIPEADKIRVRSDALLNNINFEDNLNELEEESRSR